MNLWVCKRCSTSPCYLVTQSSNKPATCFLRKDDKETPWEELDSPKTLREFTVYRCDGCTVGCYLIEPSQNSHRNPSSQCLFSGTSLRADWEVQKE